MKAEFERVRFRLGVDGVLKIFFGVVTRKEKNCFFDFVSGFSIHPVRI